ncbi:hypothetical protein LINPERPRIM_LOCUS22757 [Linum perenne]
MTRINREMVQIFSLSPQCCAMISSICFTVVYFYATFSCNLIRIAYNYDLARLMFMLCYVSC